MPATSKAQQQFMAICAHQPQHAHGKCPSQKVSKEFSHAPSGTTKGLPAHVGKPKFRKL